MKGLYRKLSMLLLVAMLFSMLGPVGVYATDVTTEAQPQATEQVGTSAPVEETDVNAQETTGEIVVDPAPVEVEGEVAPKVSQEVAAEPTASAATETDGQATADQKTEEAPQEQGSEPEKETKELTFFEQLMELKTCKEIYEILSDDVNYDKAMALTVDEVKALREYVLTLDEDDETEILVETIDQLLIALGVDVEAEYGTDATAEYKLDMKWYNSNSRVYYAVIDANRKVQGKIYVSDISLNSSTVAYGNPNGSRYGGTALNSYYSGVTSSSSGDTSRELSITPKTGYYVTRVVVACCGGQGNQSPLECNTWQAKNAYEKTFKVSAQGAISINLPAKAFAHKSESSAYFILVSVAPVPTPLYVEYDYGNIKNYLGDSYSTSAFATASGWTTASSANVYKIDTSDGGIQTANTQFKYTYATNTSGATSWKHTTNTLTDKAIADAAKAGYEFAGWAYTYYTSASASQTSEQYNNYKYTFGGEYGSGSIGAGMSLTLVTNVKLVAQWKKLTTTSVNVKKVWDDQENNDNKRPESVTVSLYMDNEDTGNDVILKESNNWEGTFTGLAVGHEYTVKEDAVKDYTSSVTGSASTGYTIKNTHTPEKTTLTVTKVWDDDDNKYKTRPTDVEVQLYYCNEDGVKTNCGDPVKLNEDGTYTFSNLWKYYKGKPITWGVEEVVKDNSAYNPTYKYNNDGTVVTVTNTLKLDNEVPVTKIWDDNSNQDGKRPGSITVTLKVNGVVFATTDEDTVWTKVDDQWNYTFENVPAGEYTIEEEAVTDYTTTVDQEKLTITNTHTPAKISVSGTKTWDDANDQDGKQPDTITVNLFANGVYKENKVVTADDDWKYTFTDLDKFKNSEEIVYTVTEEAVDGYTSTVDGYNITNSHTPETVDGGITVTKVWDDANNQDGKRPSDVTVRLLADGKEVKNAKLNEDNGWKYTFDDLPVYKNCQKITYAVTEDAVENYTTTYNGYTITNSYTPKKTSVTVTKAWDDNNNQDGMRTGSVTVNLYADGKETGKTLTLDSSNNWTGSFTDLDVYKSGNIITYTVAEKAVEGYTPEISGSADMGYVIKNTHTPEKIEKITVTKVWKDNEDQDGKRPDSIKVWLLADDENTGKYLVLTEDDNWSGFFTNLDMYANGKEIEYTVEEVAVKGYTSKVNGYNITNTHEPEKLEGGISGTKTWNDNDNQDGIRPESVTVNLLANGKKVASKTVTEKDGWKYTFTDLDKFENGKEIVYTVTEEAVKGYTAKVDGYNITNTHEPEKLEGGVSGTKTWNDKNNQDGVRPESITVNLLANGKKIDSKTVTEKDGWKYTFTDLDKYENGKKIVYTVTEEAVKGYTAKVDGYNITNTHETETTVITVEKKWVDNNDKEGKRPGEITVQLYANGVKLGDAVKITAKDGWKYEFKDLDKYANGKLVEYTVKETSEKYYVAKYTAKDDVLTITNTFVDIPLTGDTINLLFWTMMVLGAGAVLGGMGFFFRRRRT